MGFGYLDDTILGRHRDMVEYTASSVLLFQGHPASVCRVR